MADNEKNTTEQLPGQIEMVFTTTSKEYILQEQQDECEQDSQADDESQQLQDQEYLQQLKDRIKEQAKSTRAGKAAAAERIDLNLSEEEQAQRSANYQPELDPYNEAFDIEKYAEKKGGAAELRRLITKVRQNLARTQSGKNAIAKDGEIPELAAILFMNAAEAIYKFLEERPDFLKNLEEQAQLLDLIDIEVQKPEYGGKTTEEIYKEGHNEADEIIPGSLWEKATKAARQALENAPTKATAKRADILNYPLDKINSTIWNWLELAEGEQLTFAMEKRGSKTQIDAIYSINFDEMGDNLKITKQLDPFDKRVYTAIAALFNAGNPIVTVTQIYYAMGNSKRPAAHQLQKVYDSVSKMASAKIFLNNADEARRYKYDAVIYDDYLLPLKKKTAIVNGKLADAAIFLYEEPPLAAFARNRGQITTIPIKLLDSPISKTEVNLAIEDYLLERIAHAKNAKQASCKILYKTLYEHAKIGTAKQRQRTPEKVQRYLDHYKAKAHIKDYRQGKDSVTIYLQ